MTRNFAATVKDGEADDPCEVHLEAYCDIGTGMRTVVLRLQPGTSVEDARALASVLNGKVEAIGLKDLYWPNEPTKQ